MGILMSQPFWHGFTLIHFIWFVFMGLMLMHLIPNNRLSMAWKKAKETEFRPVENYDELKLLQFVQKQNIAAWKVMLLWLCFNAIWGTLYLFGVLTSSDLLMLTVFYFLCDYICILIFCPFRKSSIWSTGYFNTAAIFCQPHPWDSFAPVYTLFILTSLRFKVKMDTE